MHSFSLLTGKNGVKFFIFLDRFAEISLGSNFNGKMRQGLLIYDLSKIVIYLMVFLHSFDQNVFLSSLQNFNIFEDVMGYFNVATKFVYV